MITFRVYNQLDSTVFDLIGKTEPAQTKSLGFVLSQSSCAMNALLLHIFPKRMIAKLKGLLWTVICELPLPSGRADIVICFYHNNKPLHVIVIEGKTITGYNNPFIASGQVTKYKNDIANFFNLKAQDVTLVTLTSLKEPCNNIKNVTWSELINRLLAINNPEPVVCQLIKYLLNKNIMNQYDVEVLCIPAGKTLSFVRKHLIYECPIAGRQFKKRGLMRPLYICFRESGNNGRFDTLYKVQDVISMDMNDKLSLQELVTNDIYPDIENRINGYVSDVHPNGDKYVFILDKQHSIQLPLPVMFQNTRGMTGHIFLTLKEVLNPFPNAIILPPKNGNVAKNKNHKP